MKSLTSCLQGKKHEPSILSQAQSYLNRGLNGVVLLRHAHRQEVPGQIVSNEISITEEGHQAAVNWGGVFSVLPFQKIESSPVLRCLQTAQCIQARLEKKIEIIPSPLLGAPWNIY